MRALTGSDHSRNSKNQLASKEGDMKERRRGKGQRKERREGGKYAIFTYSKTFACRTSNQQTDTEHEQKGEMKEELSSCSEELAMKGLAGGSEAPLYFGYCQTPEEYQVVASVRESRKLSVFNSFRFIPGTICSLLAKTQE